MVNMLFIYTIVMWCLKDLLFFLLSVGRFKFNYFVYLLLGSALPHANPIKVFTCIPHWLEPAGRLGVRGPCGIQVVTMRSIQWSLLGFTGLGFGFVTLYNLAVQGQHFKHNSIKQHKKTKEIPGYERRNGGWVVPVSRSLRNNTCSKKEKGRH